METANYLYYLIPREIFQLIILAEPSLLSKIARLNKSCHHLAMELIPKLLDRPISVSELAYNAETNQDLNAPFYSPLSFSRPCYTDTIKITITQCHVGPPFLRLEREERRAPVVEEFFRVFNTPNLQPLSDRLIKHNLVWLDLASLYKIYSHRQSCVTYDKDYAYRMVWKIFQQRLKVIETQKVTIDYQQLFHELFELSNPTQKLAFNKMKQVKILEYGSILTDPQAVLVRATLDSLYLLHPIYN